MTLDPFFATPSVIQVHVVAAILAVIIGPFAIWRKRRDVLHRAAGGTWIVLMLTVATSALFINQIRLVGPFSPIHLFSILTYYTLFQAIRDVRAGRYLVHGARMRGLYLQALGIAGLFTLLPGRLMNEIIFGGDAVKGFIVMAILGVGLICMFTGKPRLQILR